MTIIIGIAGNATWAPNTIAYTVKYQGLIKTPNNVTMACGIPQYIADPKQHHIMLDFKKLINLFIFYLLCQLCVDFLTFSVKFVSSFAQHTEHLFDKYVNFVAVFLLDILLTHLIQK